MIISSKSSATHDEAERSEGWVGGQLDKVEQSLRFLETHTDRFADSVDIRTSSVGCALGYLGFRFNHLAWRGRCPRLLRCFAGFGGRASMQATMPQARAA